MKIDKKKINGYYSYLVKKHTCQFNGCSAKAIGSHVVSKSVNFDSFIYPAFAKIRGDQILYEMVPNGCGGRGNNTNPLILPLFCDAHDPIIFKDIESLPVKTPMEDYGVVAPIDHILPLIRKNLFIQHKRQLVALKHNYLSFCALFGPHPQEASYISLLDEQLNASVDNFLFAKFKIEFAPETDFDFSFAGSFICDFSNLSDDNGLIFSSAAQKFGIISCHFIRNKNDKFFVISANAPTWSEKYFFMFFYLWFSKNPSLLFAFGVLTSAYAEKSNNLLIEKTIEIKNHTFKSAHNFSGFFNIEEVFSIFKLTLNSPEFNNLGLLVEEAPFSNSSKIIETFVGDASLFKKFNNYKIKPYAYSGQDIKKINLFLDRVLVRENDFEFDVFLNIHLLIDFIDGSKNAFYLPFVIDFDRNSTCLNGEWVCQKYENIALTDLSEDTLDDGVPFYHYDINKMLVGNKLPPIEKDVSSLILKISQSIENTLLDLINNFQSNIVDFNDEFYISVAMFKTIMPQISKDISSFCNYNLFFSSTTIVCTEIDAIQHLHLERFEE